MYVMAIKVSCIQVLVLLGAFSAVFSAPVQNNISCQQTVWPLHEHRQTGYTYSASVSHYVAGSKPHSTSHLNCDVTLAVTNHCKHVLKVENCIQKNGDLNHKHKDVNDNHISSHSLVFGLNENHTIEGLMADVNDTRDSLNVKRGVLSLLQHSLQKDLEEKISQPSVHGSCNTQYNKGSETDIVMTTDLNSCAHSSIHKLLPLVRLPDRSRIQEVMPVSSRKVCSIQLNTRSQLEDISCKETHVDTVAHEQAKHRVIILQQLKLQSVRHHTPTGVLDMSTYNKIDIAHGYAKYSTRRPLQTGKNVPTSELKKNLMKLHQTFTKGDGNPLTSFKEFAEQTVSASPASLQQVLNAVLRCTLPGCSHRTKASLLSLWFESLVSCSTETCLQSAVHLVTSTPMPDSHRKQLWYSLTLTTGLTEAMINSLIETCRRQPKDACIISISITLNKEDISSSVVVKYMGLLTELLQTGCRPATIPQHSSAQISLKSLLKALHNLGDKVLLYDRLHQGDGSSMSILHKCLQNSQTDDITQLIILNIQKPHYWSESKALILEVFQDSKRSIEVRVSAFKAILQSGDSTLTSVMLDTYENEASKQFKAYITSYISSVLTDDTHSNDSVENNLKLALQSRNLSLPIKYTQSQTSMYGVLRSELSGGGMSSLETHTLYSPGSLLPNTLDLQLNIQAYGLKYNLADFVLQNEGFDFTTDIYGEKEHNGKYRHLSAIVRQTLQKLQQQVTNTYTLPFVEADFGLIGQLFGSAKLQDFSLWSAFAHSHDFHSIWQMLNLDRIISKLQDGLDLNWSKFLKVSLMEVSVPTGMGVPLKYSLNGALAFNAESSVVIRSETPIRSFLDLVEKTLEGSLDLRSVVELSSSLSVLSQQWSSSVVEQVWEHSVHQPFSLSGTDNEIALRVPVLSVQGHSSHYKISAQMLHSGGTVQAIPVDLRDKCLLSFLEYLSGWQFCDPVASNELPIVSHLRRITAQITDIIKEMAPVALKQTLTAFMQKSIDFVSSAFVLKIKFPTSSNNSLQPQHWLELLNGAWVRVREAAVTVPSTYTATLYDAGTVVTFDGQLYNFPGCNNEHCTYVLANDYSGYKFTLLQSRDYMTALLNEITVSLYKDGRVMVNNSGEFSDLPLFSWNNNVAVRREGSILQLTTLYGVGVTCNIDAHFCTYTLNGWYHNRTLGLLGTNDNQASNDFKLRDGSMMRSVSGFVNAYEITGASGCEQRPLRRKARDVCTPSEKAQMCENLFRKRNSPLAACFPFINPVPYKGVCLNQRSCAVGTHENSQSACYIATVYAQMCLQKGIQVWPVPQCVLCHTHSNESNEATKGVGQTWTEQLEQKLDLVVVTSLHEDMVAPGVPLAMYFKHMVASIQRHLGNEDFDDVQIGLIGYDGTDMMQEPHAYTFNGKLFSTSQNLATLNEKISLMSAEGSASGKHSNALQLASEYPFRAEAVRLVVWLSPAQQQKGDVTSVLEDYEKINLNLNSVDVSFEQPSQSQGRKNSVFTRQLPLKIRPTSQHYRHSIHRVTETIKDNVLTYSKQCQTCQCQVNQFALGQIYCQNTKCL